MRSVVVLPAPLGPSRPVIWPSWAWKLTPSTALTTPLRVLKDLWRSWAVIMGLGRSRRGDAREPGGSRLPSVERGERRHVAEAVQAAGIERPGLQRLDELADQLRRAAHGHRAVALAAQHQVARVGQALGHFLAVHRRRHRVEF